MKEVNCPICKTKNQNIESQQFCEECGWEFIGIPNTASKELKKYKEEKEADCRKRYETHIKDIKNLQEEKGKLKKNLDSTLKEKEEKETDLVTANTKNRELETKFKNKELEIKGLEKQIKEISAKAAREDEILKAAITKAEKEKNTLIVVQTNLKKTIDEKNKSLAEKEKSLAEKEKTIEEKQNELSNIETQKSENEKQKQENEIAKTEIDKQKEEHEKTRKENVKLTNKLKNSENEKTTTQNENKKLIEDTNKIKKTHKEFIKQLNEKHIEDINKIKTTHQEIIKQLKEKHKENIVNLYGGIRDIILNQQGIVETRQKGSTENINFDRLRNELNDLFEDKNKQCEKRIKQTAIRRNWIIGLSIASFALLLLVCIVLMTAPNKKNPTLLHDSQVSYTELGTAPNKKNPTLLPDWRGMIVSAMNSNPTFYWECGDMYKGEKNNDVPNGLGAYYCWNGFFYFGVSSENKSIYGIDITNNLENDSIFHYNCPGCKFYVGNRSNDKKSGIGKCYDKTGKLIYYGKFEDDKPIDTYPSTGDYSAYKFEIIPFDSVTYVGETKDGKRYGKGILLWQNGDMWYGGWKDGIRFGYGIKIYEDGTMNTGTWVNDIHTPTIKRNF